MKKYLAILKAKLKLNFTEKEIMIVWSLSSGIAVISLISVWLASKNSQFSGYNKQQLITYYILTYLLEQVLNWSFFWEIRRNILEGQISKFFLQPINYFKYIFTHELAYKIINTAVQLIVSTVFLVLFIKYLEIPIQKDSIWKLIPAIFLGIGITSFVNLINGGLTFIFKESKFLQTFLSVFQSLFGGRTMPISFFPDQLQIILKINPFRYTMSFPLEIIFNQLSTREFYQGLCIGLAWIIVLAIILRFTWKKGIKKYTHFGV